MTDSYLSVDGVCSSEKTIEKSRFIATSAHVESDAEAKEFVAKISKRYSDATHNCFAYIADRGAQLLRFSDAGEPSGTAGIPILEVIKNRGLVYIAVVVTRYFGGIKLGAGGLVRAYSGSCAENLSVAKVRMYSLFNGVTLTTDYPLATAAAKFLEKAGARDLRTEYGEKVNFNLYVRAGESEAFVRDAVRTLNGAATVLRTGESRYLPED
ncbi:MAG: YigZ family protein [Clostridia bacterium]|nr:YigZ family protein [Clostridia bacterium]